VRPGGRLTYVVCSLLDAEGPDVIAAFLAANPQWRAAEQDVGAGTPRGAGLRLTPWDDATDGFFFATLQRL
jgi:16S rRNA (cytosine967-C5)-methyltransferase